MIIYSGSASAALVAARSGPSGGQCMSRLVLHKHSRTKKRARRRVRTHVLRDLAWDRTKQVGPVVSYLSSPRALTAPPAVAGAQLPPA